MFTKEAQRAAKALRKAESANKAAAKPASSSASSSGGGSHKKEQASSGDGMRGGAGNCASFCRFPTPTLVDDDDETQPVSCQ